MACLAGSLLSLEWREVRWASHALTHLHKQCSVGFEGWPEAYSEDDRAALRLPSTARLLAMASEISESARSSGSSLTDCVVVSAAEVRRPQGAAGRDRQSVRFVSVSEENLRAFSISLSL